MAEQEELQKVLLKCVGNNSGYGTINVSVLQTEHSANDDIRTEKPDHKTALATHAVADSMDDSNTITLDTLPCGAPSARPHWLAELGLSPLSAEEKQRRQKLLLEQCRGMLKYGWQELCNHSLPLVIIATFILCPPILLFWVPAVMLWWIAEAVYRRISPMSRTKLKRVLPQKWIESRIFRELLDGMPQVRPFILASLYIFCVPFALVWMGAHWLFKLNRLVLEQNRGALAAPDSVSFLQNPRLCQEEEEENFFHSPAFAMTCVFLFVSGAPAFITYLLYQYFGIDAILGFPSVDPRFKTVFLRVGLYLGSIAWCGSVLFFRSWFTFPLNFASDEEEIELNESGVRRRGNSWFTQVLTFNTPGKGPESLNWSEIKNLRLDLSNSPFYPLPQTAFPANSPLYSILNQLALFMDGIQKNVRQDQHIYFTTDGTFSDRYPTMPIIEHSLRSESRSIRINLTDLNGDERARLYYAVRKWAPHVLIDESVQEKMMGTTVLQTPAYTQLWFELLADKIPVRFAGILPPDTKLQDGAFVIKERISSGGQANIYLAQACDGRHYVLKEFILSTSDAVGALLESAGEFEVEVTLLSQLKHPRIVKMHSFFSESKRLYIVLEKIEGMSLRELVKTAGRPLLEREVIDITLQVCDVLQFLHEQQAPVVHRDIAPDNLMFNPADGVKIIDFSLAAAKKSRRATSTMGKHSYSPPEQFREQACPQSDIYALGATMYYLLTSEDPKPIAQSDAKINRPDISQRLNELIKQATAFNLEDRYPSVQWLKTELEEILAEIDGKMPTGVEAAIETAIRKSDNLKLIARRRVLPCNESTRK